MKTIIDNIVVNYNDTGNGDIILFLHGWQDNLHTFDNMIDILKNKYRCISLDIPGFGESEYPPLNWHLIDYVYFVNKFVQKLNIDIFTIIGHSFGGRIILKGIGNNILSAKKVVLIASAGIVEKNIKKYIFNILSKYANILLNLPILNIYKNKIKYIFYKKIGSDYIYAGRLKNIFINIINEDLQKYATNIDVPTLLIWGKKDSETPIHYANIFHKLIKQSRLIIVENEGHFVHQTKYKDIAKYIDTFISS